MILPPPTSTLFPYTTLFRSRSLPVLELAYETYGTHSPTENSAVLVVHGYTSSHHAAGRNAKGKQGRGVTEGALGDRKSTRLNSSHRCISYAVFCLKKKTIK